MGKKPDTGRAGLIEKVRIQGFKGFNEIALSPLSRITLIGGENSVGKSSLLEAVFLFFDRRNPDMLLRQFAWRGMTRVYLSTEQIFNPAFHDYSTANDIVITLTIAGVEERLTIKFDEQYEDRQIRYERVRNGVKHVRTDERPILNGRLQLDLNRQGHNEAWSLVVTEKGLTLREGSSRIERRPAAYISPRVPSSPAEDAQRFGALDVKGEIGDAVAFLKRFDGRVNGLSSIFYGESSVIHADVGLSRKVPLPQLGEGLSFMMSMYLAMSAVRNGTLLVDEIGSGIHHSYLPKFWEGVSEAAKRFDCQVIATTHSYECLQAAVTGLRSLVDPEFGYVRLDRGPKGVTPTVYPFPIFEASLESGWEVR